MNVKYYIKQKIRKIASRISLAKAVGTYCNHVRAGYQIYRELKTIYGDDCAIMFCPHKGTGDIYAIGLYLDSFIAKKNISKFVFLFRGNAEKKVSELFPIFDRAIDKLIFDDIKTAELSNYLTFMGEDCTDIIQIHHCSLNRQLVVTSGVEGFHGISMMDMYVRVCFGLPENSQKSTPQFNELNQKIILEFQKKSLKPGKTVIISPYSTCISPLPNWFWGDIVKELKRNGYTVCTNSAGAHEPVIEGTVPIFFSYRDAIAALEYAGFFIAVRSGLCDIISSASCKKFVFYPNKVFFCPPNRTLEYVGLENMGLCKDFEFLFDDDFLNLEFRLLKSMEKEKMVRCRRNSMENEKLLSVIISAYNSEKTVRRVLESATRQGLGEKQLEIVVINNGSTDKTAQILEAFKQDVWPTLKVVTKKKNIGISAARNLGIECATGNYVTFCDSDDELVNGAYSEMCMLADRSHADVIVGSYYDVWDNGTVVLNKINASESTFSKVFFGGTVWCKLYNRSFIEKNRIRFPTTNHMEDNVFLGYVSLYAKEAVVYDKPMYKYMRGFPDTNALSKNTTLESFMDSVQSIKMLYSLPLKCSSEERFYCIAGALKYLNVLFNGMNQYENRKIAFELLQDIVRMNDWSIHRESFYEIYPLLRSEFEFLQINYDSFVIITNLRNSEHTCQCESGQICSPLSRDITLTEFRHGQIGFKYIIKYMHAWLKFKIVGSRGA